ncbi:MAG: MinD/ParA family protein [Phycisphaeraceae bacterium]|nr:MinD/ParA family protein [Phycisphaeraceae bacterium]
MMTDQAEALRRMVTESTPTPAPGSAPGSVPGNPGTPGNPGSSSGSGPTMAAGTGSVLGSHASAAVSAGHRSPPLAGQSRIVSVTSPLRGQTLARVVAITSGKGGVGKSSMAVNLAIRLAQMGRRVILVDADLGTANADVLCNLAPSASLAHVVAGRKTIGQILIDAPGGFRLLPGASGLSQIAALGELERVRLVEQLRQLEEQADLLIFDTGAGVSPNVLSFVAAADQQLVVTTPEPTAITDAYAVIKSVYRRRPDADFRILVNMVRSSDEAIAVFTRLDAVCRRFLKLTPRFAGHVMLDARVSLAVRRRVPFVLENPRCEASLCIGQLAHRMDRHAAEPRDMGIWHRLTHWWIDKRNPLV